MFLKLIQTKILLNNSIIHFVYFNLKITNRDPFIKTIIWLTEIRSIYDYLKRFIQPTSNLFAVFCGFSTAIWTTFCFCWTSLCFSVATIWAGFICLVWTGFHFCVIFIWAIWTSLCIVRTCFFFFLFTKHNISFL